MGSPIQWPTLRMGETNDGRSVYRDASGAFRFSGNMGGRAVVRLLRWLVTKGNH